MKDDFHIGELSVLKAQARAHSGKSARMQVESA